VHFPISGVDGPVLLPALAAFVAAMVCVPAGLSGGVVLLPFQMSVLRFVTPAVTPTNLLYNVFSTPGGVYRFVREQRMLWPLAGTIVTGSLPGVLLGSFVRLRYLLEPRTMRLFTGAVLLWLAIRLFWNLRWTGRAKTVQASMAHSPVSALKTTLVSLARIEYEFQGRCYGFRPWPLAGVSLGAGVLFGAYGAGGNAILAPYLVSVLRLPPHTVAGATLVGTFATSLAGVCAFEGAGYLTNHAAVHPDWLLGAMFGFGGLLGAYAGAWLQRFLSEVWIKLTLGFMVFAVAMRYISAYFL
jgi:uncharacterized membrane protein YfcA